MHLKIIHMNLTSIKYFTISILLSSESNSTDSGGKSIKEPKKVVI